MRAASPSFCFLKVIFRTRDGGGNDADGIRKPIVLVTEEGDALSCAIRIHQISGLSLLLKICTGVVAIR